MKKPFYSLTQTKKKATINIYGDITSWPWLESDVSAANLSQKLDEMGDVSEIDVYINSYGGEVAEGIAIYNALKRHKAKVTTFCDGFACSIASVIFMAGDERVMMNPSMLMIHNAWTLATGNADELRKQADDLEKITQLSVDVYESRSTLTAKEIKKMMDKETWISATEALEYGFATAIDSSEAEHESQNARQSLFDIIRKYQSGEVDPGVGNDPEVEPKLEEPETPNEETPDEPETEDEPEIEDEPEEPAAQKWSGFFNAFLSFERRTTK